MIHFFSFFNFLLIRVLEKSEQSAGNSSNWASSWWNRASDDPLFPFFPGHISRKIWTIFWKSLQIEPNLVKTSSKWSTFSFCLFFVFSEHISGKIWTFCPKYLLIAPNLVNFISWWSTFFTFSKKSLGGGIGKLRWRGG